MSIIKKIRNLFISQSPVYTIFNGRAEAIFQTADKNEAITHMRAIASDEYLCLIDANKVRVLLQYDGFRQEFF